MRSPGRRRASRLLPVALAASLLLALSGGCGDHHDPDAVDYDLEFWVTGSAARFGALQFEVTHVGNRGEFLGRGDQVECESLVDAIVAANYAGERQLKVGLISLAGIRIPSAIVRCGFRTSEDLAPSDFLVAVTDASDTTSEPLDPAPTVTVASVTAR